MVGEGVRGTLLAPEHLDRGLDDAVQHAFELLLSVEDAGPIWPPR